MQTHVSFLSRRSFLSTALAAGAALSVQAADQAPLIAYVGTFTSPLQNMKATQVDLPPGNGQGIHLFEVNRETGAMTPCGLYKSGSSPNCLAFNAKRTVLYSTNETDANGNHEAGTVSSFAINPKNGELTLMNTVSSGGKGPTYISLHPSGRFLLVAAWVKPPTSSRTREPSAPRKPPTRLPAALPSADMMARTPT